MIHFTCNDCQVGFIARSREEAEDEAKEAAKTEDFDGNAELVYARRCPYCGSFAIKER